MKSNINREMTNIGPGFIVVGNQKSGTTWLYDRLLELDEYDLLPVKELHYFDRNSKYPSTNLLAEDTFYRRLRDPIFRRILKTRVWKSLRYREWLKFSWYLKFYFSKYSDQWYLSLFNPEKGISGDFTPSYMLLDNDDVERMARICSNSKIIFILRNPIERAISQYKSLKYKTLLNGGESMEEMKAFFNSKFMTDRLQYDEAVNKYKRYFGEENVLIAYYDDLLKNPELFLKGIVSFTGGIV